MCGIAGIIESGPGAPLRERLAAMSQALVHRGPDDSAALVGEKEGLAAGLCATRLAIQDTSERGRQPMVSSRTGIWLAFNGELFNGEDLRRELKSAGYSFTGSSDTEVLLAAWDEWKTKAVPRLRGMFAFAVWDPAGNELTLVRDRLGIKPMYYSRFGHGIAFASELRSLLLSERVPRALSPSGLASYLQFGSVIEPDSLVEAVRALPPATYLRWTPKRADIMEYWSLRDCFHGDGGKGTTTEPSVELRELLEDAVKRHLVSDVPLGVLLSGGLDSSAMVGLVSETSGSPPETVSVVFPERSYSENTYIELVRRRFRTKHTQVELSGDDFRAELPSALSAMDQPTMDAINTFVVCKMAKASGLTVVLSGLGGDELFGGYATFHRSPRLELLRRLLPAPARAAGSFAARARLGDTDRGRKLVRFLRASSPGSAYHMQRELFNVEEVTRLMGSQGGNVESHAPSHPPDTDPVNVVSYLELCHYMRNLLLRDSDVMSMAHGVELRAPFLDHQVVEYVASRPGSEKVKTGVSKPLLAQAVEDLVPQEIRDRPKMGFTFPFEEWLRGPLKGLVQGRLREPGAGGAVSEVLNPEAVNETWTRFESRRTSWSRPWALYVLKTWADRHLSSDTSATKHFVRTTTVSDRPQ
jgi:asparagine synthase (glutamine-hydrolysing)